MSISTSWCANTPNLSTLMKANLKLPALEDQLGVFLVAYQQHGTLNQLSDIEQSHSLLKSVFFIEFPTLAELKEKYAISVSQAYLTAFVEQLFLLNTVYYLVTSLSLLREYSIQEILTTCEEKAFENTVLAIKQLENESTPCTQSPILPLIQASKPIIGMITECMSYTHTELISVYIRTDSVFHFNEYLAHVLNQMLNPNNDLSESTL